MGKLYTPLYFGNPSAIFSMGDTGSNSFAKDVAGRVFLFIQQIQKLVVNTTTFSAAGFSYARSFTNTPKGVTWDFDLVHDLRDPSSTVLLSFTVSIEDGNMENAFLSCSDSEGKQLARIPVRQGSGLSESLAISLVSYLKGVI